MKSGICLCLSIFLSAWIISIPMESGSIKFILLKKIGKAIIDETVTEQEMLAAVNEIYFSEGDAHE